MKNMWNNLGIIVLAVLCAAGCGPQQNLQGASADEVLSGQIEKKISQEIDERLDREIAARIDQKLEHVKGERAVRDIPVLAPDGIQSSGKANHRRNTEKRFRLEDEQNTVDIFNEAAPQTVYVTQNRVVQSMWMQEAMEVPAGTGSGFIWDKSGYVVTNYHVVADGSTLTVTLYNHKSYPARLVGAEPKKDIAVLKIDAPAGELSPISVPEEGYEIFVGQKALAIGNPFGLDHTLTTGVISAIGRERPGIGGVTIRDMIQTDASINMGNSGGPLLDSEGHLIGMNTMIYSKSGGSDGIGFAIPISIIRRIVPQIIKTGKVQQIGLGITILPDSVARQNGINGVIIRAVNENSPAGKSGLKGLSINSKGAVIGDVIIGIDDKPVTNYDDLYNELDAHKAGEKVNVKVLRDGQTQIIPVEVYVLPE